MNLKSGRLLFPCVLLESSENFPPNPYYEPLSWFMIAFLSLTVLLAIKIKNVIKKVSIYKTSRDINVWCRFFKTWHRQRTGNYFLNLVNSLCSNLLSVVSWACWSTLTAQYKHIILKLEVIYMLLHVYQFFITYQALKNLVKSFLTKPWLSTPALALKSQSYHA